MTTPAAHVWRPSTARVVVLDGLATTLRSSALSASTTASGTVPSWPSKDPGDVLDYRLDISNTVAGDSGDAIISIDAAISPNGAGDLSLVSAAMDGCAAVLWLGSGQAGTTYTVTLTIGTASGRTLVRGILLPVADLSAPSTVAGGLTTESGSIITDQNGNPIIVGG